LFFVANDIADKYIYTHVHLMVSNFSRQRTDHSSCETFMSHIEMKGYMIKKIAVGVKERLELKPYRLKMYNNCTKSKESQLM